VTFALVLFIALVVTGAIILFDRFRKRSNSTNSKDKKDSKALSIIVEYARALFPVVLLVFVLRSFVVEPFRIPSGSMLPTLFIGDFILVDKFRYGIRLPIINVTIFRTGSPKRGDVMVFRYPQDTSINFIKRVIGLPGDEIIYDKKQLFINGELLKREESDSYKLDTGNQNSLIVEYRESIGATEHRIINDLGRGSRSMKISVPKGSYFVMGDNRDHSNDSRFWGFVPEKNIVGRAFWVWLSWNPKEGGVNWSRIGHVIL